MSRLKGDSLKALLATLLLGLTSTQTLAAPAEIAPPGPQDRCPVCGMFVAPYPAWLAAVELADATTIYFDGPNDMFTYLADRATYHPGTSPPAIAAVIVTDYYTRQPHAAEEVFFVSGSDVLGPMGHERVPVGSAAALESFLQDHGGDTVEVYRDGRLEGIAAP